MTPYAIYDVATGRIARSGHGMEADARAHIGAGQDILLIEADWRTQYISAGAPVAIPPSPSDRHEWNWQAKAWGLKPLADLQAAKWEEMKLQRSAAIEAPLVTPYGTFDADELSRTNIAQTAQFAQTQAQSLAPGLTPLVDFTLANNTVVTLTAQQMIQVALLLASQVQTAYARGRTVRAAIQACTTAAQVAAITWSTP